MYMCPVTLRNRWNLGSALFGEGRGTTPTAACGGTEEICIQVQRLFPGDGYAVSRMRRVPSGNLPGVRLRIRI